MCGLPTGLPSGPRRQDRAPAGPYAPSPCKAGLSLVGIRAGAGPGTHQRPAPGPPRRAPEQPSTHSVSRTAAALAITDRSRSWRAPGLASHENALPISHPRTFCSAVGEPAEPALSGALGFQQQDRRHRRAGRRHPSWPPAPKLTVGAYASFADDNASGNPASNALRQASRHRLRQAARWSANRSATHGPGSCPAHASARRSSRRP